MLFFERESQVRIIFCFLVSACCFAGCQTTANFRTFEDDTKKFENDFSDFRFIKTNGVTDSELSEYLGCFGTDNQRTCPVLPFNITITVQNKPLFSGVTRNVNNTARSKPSCGVARDCQAGAAARRSLVPRKRAEVERGAVVCLPARA